MLDHRLVEILAVGEPGDAGATGSFDQDLDGAIGQLEQLQHRCDGADLEQRRGRGIVVGSVALGDEKNLLVLAHHLFQGLDGLLATDEQRHDHVRKDDDVAQRQHRIEGIGVTGLLHCWRLFGHGTLASFRSAPQSPPGTFHVPWRANPGDAHDSDGADGKRVLPYSSSRARFDQKLLPTLRRKMDGGQRKFNPCPSGRGRRDAAEPDHRPAVGSRRSAAAWARRALRPRPGRSWQSFRGRRR